MLECIFKQFDCLAFLDALFPQILEYILSHTVAEQACHVRSDLDGRPGDLLIIAVIVAARASTSPF